MEARSERRSLKYIRLAAHLASQPAEIERITLSLPEIEAIVGETLPPNARFPSWWKNDDRKMHSRAWLTAGWQVDAIAGDSHAVEFVRTRG
ncbi:MAG TPA: hypothetical protein VFK89_07875 [Actinomycetota bacterium]|nr:hypothetical protein [Actinomycetota bacterium]